MNPVNENTLNRVRTALEGVETADAAKARGRAYLCKYGIHKPGSSITDALVNDAEALRSLVGEMNSRGAGDGNTAVCEGNGDNGRISDEALQSSWVNLRRAHVSDIPNIRSIARELVTARAELKELRQRIDNRTDLRTQRDNARESLSKALDLAERQAAEIGELRGKITVLVIESESFAAAARGIAA